MSPFSKHADLLRTAISWNPLQAHNSRIHRLFPQDTSLLSDGVSPALQALAVAASGSMEATVSPEAVYPAHSLEDASSARGWLCTAHIRTAPEISKGPLEAPLSLLTVIHLDKVPCRHTSLSSNDAMRLNPQFLACINIYMALWRSRAQ